MPLPPELEKQLGPLKVWQWGAVGAVGIAVLLLYLKKKSGSKAVTIAPQSSGDTTGLGAGSGSYYGDTSGGGTPYAATPYTYICADGSTVSDPTQCQPSTAAPVQTTQTCAAGETYSLGVGCLPNPTSSTPVTAAPFIPPACGPGQIYVQGQGCLNPGGQDVCSPGYYNNGSGCVPQSTSYGAPIQQNSVCPPGEYLSLGNGCAPTGFGVAIPGTSNWV